MISVHLLADSADQACQCQGAHQLGQEADTPDTGSEQLGLVVCITCIPSDNTAQ